MRFWVHMGPHGIINGFIWVHMGFGHSHGGFQRIVQTLNRYSVIKQKKGYVQVFVLDIGTNGCVRVTLKS